MITKKFLFLVGVSLVVSCHRKTEIADAYGNFEAEEVLVSAETSGPVVKTLFNEGDEVKTGQLAVEIDSVQYSLKHKELIAKQQVTKARLNNLSAQSEVFEKQKQVAVNDLVRLQKMLAEGAATQKQLDDLRGQIAVLDKQMAAVVSNREGIFAEVTAIDAAIGQSGDMLRRTKVFFPSNGIVLEKYIDPGEMAMPGKALFKIANLKVLRLKAYISGLQLAEITIGDTVQVVIDGGGGEPIKYPGTITWVSSKAEFTPKIIQTKEERVNLVYAIRVEVMNDGRLKIGMPGEIFFQSSYK